MLPLLDRIEVCGLPVEGIESPFELFDVYLRVRVPVRPRVKHI